MLEERAVTGEKWQTSRQKDIVHPSIESARRQFAAGLSLLLLLLMDECAIFIQQWTNAEILLNRLLFFNDIVVVVIVIVVIQIDWPPKTSRAFIIVINLRLMLIGPRLKVHFRSHFQQSIHTEEMNWCIYNQYQLNLLKNISKMLKAVVVYLYLISNRSPWPRVESPSGCKMRTELSKNSRAPLYYRPLIWSVTNLQNEIGAEAEAEAAK